MARDSSGRFVSAGAGPRGAGGLSVQIRMEQRSYDRAIKRLARYEGKPLKFRARKAVLEGAKRGVRPIKGSGDFKSRTGRLRGSVTARMAKTRPGEMAAATVGPRSGKAPHRGLISRGHRIVTTSGRDTGRRVPGDPWVDTAFSEYGEKARDLVKTQVLALGPSLWTGLGEIETF